MKRTVVGTQAEVVAFLERRETYPPSTSNADNKVDHIETHISHVFLTGQHAYKLKKAVKFEFLDFSSLEKRKHFCEEEVRLGSRFAPELYLEVVAISRKEGRIILGIGDEVLDYVIKMRQFDKDSLFDSLAVRGELHESLLLQITDRISEFHLQAVPAPTYWGAEYVVRTLRSNIDACSPYCPEVFEHTELDLLRARLETEFLKHKKLIEKRQYTHVRAVHGDLHLRNMCIFQGKALLFDGIEFNPELSNCDVCADLAFFVMDLMFRDRFEDAALVWNHYLQETDDFEGFELLDLYVSYRAGVRAQVACLALDSAHARDEYSKLRSDAGRYLQLARKALETGRPSVIAVGGLAGTGKSTLSSLLARRVHGAHIRSDAVRKHLAAVPLTQHAPAEAYSEEMNEKTYRGLLERAQHVLHAGHPVILDATFHSPERREEVEAFAEGNGLPFTGIWCAVSPKIAMERVRLRAGDISDADESVITLQQSYRVGEIRWHNLDTAQHELQTAAVAMSWINAMDSR